MPELLIYWILCMTVLTVSMSIYHAESLPTDGSSVQSDGSVKPFILAKTPQNIAAVVGDTVILECMVEQTPHNAKAMWWEYSTNTGGALVSVGENIHPSHPNSARYGVIHTTTTEYSLMIKNIQLSDGGKYRCSDIFVGPSDEFMGEAELIVLESAPVCTSSVKSNGVVADGEKYTAECSVRYQGKYAPTMTWFGPPSFNRTQPSTGSGVVKAGIEFKVDRSMDWVVYQCKTNFTDIGKVTDHAADNTPAWQSTHTSTPLVVHWGPTKTYIEPLKDEYSVGDVLTCYSDSNPAPLYTWQNVRTYDVFTAQTFTVTENLAETNQTCRCQAQNLINGFLYSETISVNVNVSRKNL